MQRFGNNCAPLHFGSKFYKLGRWSTELTAAATAQQPRDKSTIGISVSRSTKGERPETRDPTHSRLPYAPESEFQSGFVAGRWSIIGSFFFSSASAFRLGYCTHLDVPLSLRSSDESRSRTLSGPSINQKTQSRGVHKSD